MAKAKQTSPAPFAGKFLRVLPLYVRQLDPEAEPLPVALWRCDGSYCQGAGGTRCDDSEGLLYTVAGAELTYWCPRHWYERVLGPGAPYRLLDMTDEQYAEEAAAHKTRIRERLKTASERLQQAAGILDHCGLTEQSGRLWEADGWIRSSIARL